MWLAVVAQKRESEGDGGGSRWWLAVVAHGGREGGFGFFGCDQMKKTDQEIVFYKLTLVIRCDMSHLILK